MSIKVYQNIIRYHFENGNSFMHQTSGLLRKGIAHGAFFLYNEETGGKNAWVKKTIERPEGRRNYGRI
ncbi:MAG: hypothetical protein IJX90_05940 [Blautia sp.]|nr:hypothetical protein [Blautia sp.]